MKVILSLIVVGLSTPVVSFGACPLPPAAVNNWTVPQLLNIVGHHNGSADAAGIFTVVIRDENGNPVQNQFVSLDLHEIRDLRMCSESLDDFATVDCVTKTVRKLTDPLGSATFIVEGTADRSLISITNSARVICCNQEKRILVTAIFDQDGGGCGPSDVTLAIHDVNAGSYVARSDYTGNGILEPNDIPIILAIANHGTSDQACGTYCP